MDTKVTIQSKLPRTGRSIFSVMSELAKRNQAINLSQGFPGFDCKDQLKKLVSKYMRQGFNQYAPMEGVGVLRVNLAHKIQSSYGVGIDPDQEITVTAGATQALFTAITSLVREGDEVMIFEPAYDSYIPSIKMAGGTPITVQLKGPEFRIPWQEVKNKLSFRTRMIILNSPHNPSGCTLNEEDIKQLRIITEGNDIILLSDEVYEHIIYDGAEHLSIMRYPDLYRRSLCVFSFGKVYHNTGWKLGYIIAPEYMTKEFRKVHQFNVFSVNTPMQYALAEFLQKPKHYEELAAFYEEKRNHFLSLMKDSKFQFRPTEGSYFQLLDYSEISDENDISFAERLAIEHKVATIPVSPFYSNESEERFIRVCFAKNNEELEKAAEILCKI